MACSTIVIMIGSKHLATGIIGQDKQSLFVAIVCSMNAIQTWVTDALHRPMFSSVMSQLHAKHGHDLALSHCVLMSSRLSSKQHSLMDEMR